MKWRTLAGTSLPLASMMTSVVGPVRRHEMLTTREAVAVGAIAAVGRAAGVAGRGAAVGVSSGVEI